MDDVGGERQAVEIYRYKIMNKARNARDNAEGGLCARRVKTYALNTLPGAFYDSGWRYRRVLTIFSRWRGVLTKHGRNLIIVLATTFSLYIGYQVRRIEMFSGLHVLRSSTFVFD